MASLSVHLANPPAPEVLQSLLGRLDGSIYVTLGPEWPDPATFEVLVAGRPSAAELAASPELRALVIPWAGLPEATAALLADYPGLSVHNLHHNAASTAEMALALLLAAAKRLVPADRALRAGDWTPRYTGVKPVLLAGRTALVLGYGHVGRRVARGLVGLGLAVNAVRRSAPVGELLEAGVSLWSPDRLPALLEQTHVLVVALPLTAATRGLIGEAELAAMPPGGLLVNIARGPIVDEQALYAALASGHLAGAGLDVWYGYPSDPASRASTRPASLPFEALPHVVMTPHLGGQTGDTETLRMAALAELLNAAARGGPIPNPVDVAAGY